MIVLKFGGTSVGDAEHICGVAKIIANRLDRKPLIVVSAHAGVTNMLEETAKKAVRGQYSVAPLREIHQKILRDLALESGLHDPFFKELEDLLRGISLVGELTPRSLDYVFSFGERMSTRTLAAYLNKEGIDAQAWDAFDLGLITDSRFGRARPLPESANDIKARVEKSKGVCVVTGYIAKDVAGNITTLGRNGSDYSAAIFGNAVDAEEIQIWTDVDGVMTADPRIVTEAKPIREISFDEASELAYYGGKVLHPSTLVPAITKDIPVRVLNTRNPNHSGTVIMKHAAPGESPVRSVVYKKDVFLISVSTPRMLGQPGFMAKLFSVFDRHEIVIDMIATTEVSVSVTTDSAKNLPEAVSELKTFAKITVEKDCGIVCAVGDGIREAIGVQGQMFSALSEHKVPVRMISQGALRVNVGILVQGQHVDTAVRALHRSFFKGGRR